MNAKNLLTMAARPAALAAVVLGVTLMQLPVSAQPASQPAAKDKDAKKTTDAAPNDLLIFHTGKQVEGRILEETATTVRMIVRGAGGIEAETTYNKSEILKIEKGGGSVAGAKVDKVDVSTDKKKDDKKLRGPGVGASDAQTVYMITFSGKIGRDVSQTPLREVMKDARKQQPDVLVIKVDCAFEGDLQIPTPADANLAFSQLMNVRELSTIITDEIRDDPQWVKKPRRVMWVNQALGGAAFVPLVWPEIYYTSEARHGGIGYLEFIFGSTGDEVVRQKQFSLRQAWAEGLAAMGGHDARLIRAMARADYVLSVSFVNGKPEFHEDTTGDILLTDDGKDERKDTSPEIARGKGNDNLNLDADMAVKLGLGNGKADDVKELMFGLGIDRSYVLVDSKADSIFKDWSDGVDRAEREFRRLFQEYQRVRPTADTSAARNAARGKQIQILLEVKALLDRYKEAIDAQAIQGAPEQWDTRINLLIERLRQEIRLDKERR